MKDITPKKLRCSLLACPAVLELSADDLLVIGKKLTVEQLASVAYRIGDGEVALVIPRAYFAGMR